MAVASTGGLPVEVSSAELIQVPRYCGRIREQSIHGDQRRDGRKDGQNAVVRHARRERQQPMLRYVAIDAQQDALPALGISEGFRCPTDVTVLCLKGLLSTR